MASFNRIVPAEHRHILRIAERLRDDDRRELWSSARLKPKEGLEKSFERSEMRWTAFRGLRPVVMWGVARASIIGSAGVPWLMATDEIMDMRYFVLENTRIYIDHIKNFYSRLENYVDARNKEAIRWLEWSGFTLLPSEPYGFDRLPFHRFFMEGLKCVR